MIFYYGIFIGIISSVFGFSEPETACRTLMPKHNNYQPQRGLSPFKLFVSSQNIRSCEYLRVSIRSDTRANTFLGFLIKGVDLKTRQIIGKFRISPKDPSSQELDCGIGVASAATHKKNRTNSLDAVSFYWSSHNNYTGTMIFNATIVVSFPIFWVGLLSVPVRIS